MNARGREREGKRERERERDIERGVPKLPSTCLVCLSHPFMNTCMNSSINVVIDKLLLCSPSLPLNEWASGTQSIQMFIKGTCCLAFKYACFPTTQSALQSLPNIHPFTRTRQCVYHALLQPARREQLRLAACCLAQELAIERTTLQPNRSTA